LLIAATTTLEHCSSTDNILLGFDSIYKGESITSELQGILQLSERSAHAKVDVEGLQRF